MISGRRLRGFTLVELMVVVVIIAILAVVAMTSYSRYKRSARQGEGVAAINDIRMKQETFFSTYKRYQTSAGVDGGWDGEWLSGDFVEFAAWTGADCPNADDAWCNLGWRPPLHAAGGRQDLMYFQFLTAGWQPGAEAPDEIQNPDVRWVVARARGLPQDPRGGPGKCMDITVTNESADAIILTEQACSGP